MKKTLLSVLAITFIIGTAQQARAQGFISPLVGYDFGGDAKCPGLNTVNSCQDKKVNVAVGFGVIGSVFGFEEEVAYAPNFFGTSAGLNSSVLTLMSNPMFAPKIGPVRPYVLAGIGLIKTHVDLTTTSLLTTDNNSLGWDVGGGLMIFLGGHFGVRGDLRYVHAFQDLTVQGFTLGNTTLNYGRAAAGVVLKF
jgi:opacity protein-like surface antigen